MIMSEKFKLLSQKCAAVAVFRNLKRDRVVSALMSIIAVPENDLQQKQDHHHSLPSVR